MLQSHVPDNLVDRARGILQLFKLFAPALPLPTLVGAAVLTSAANWRSHPGPELSLEDSLLLEFESGASEDRTRREADAAFENVNGPQRGFALFRFVLSGAGSIEKRRVEAVNAFLKLVPNTGLALLNVLLKGTNREPRSKIVHLAPADTHRRVKAD